MSRCTTRWSWNLSTLPGDQVRAADFSGIDDTFVVANGDVLTDLDIAALVEFHRSHSAEATIHLIGVDDPSAFGVVATDGDGRVERFVEKPAPGTAPSNQINGGTYVLEPSVLQRIPGGQKVSIERSTFPAVVESGRLFAMATDDYWLDAGNPALYLKANLDLLDGTRRPHGIVGVHSDAQIDPSSNVTRSIVAAGASVGSGSTITDSVLLDGAVVEDGAVVTNSVVMGMIGRGAVVHDTVLGLHGRIESGEHVSGELPTIRRLDVNILVVGGAGFLGSHLVDRLIAEETPSTSSTTCRAARLQILPTPGRPVVR